MIYIYTPETLKNEIDKLAKDKGFKFFLLSSELHGTAFAPSKKVPSYRIPVAVPNVFTENKFGLGGAMKGFYMLGITDPAVFDEEAQKVCQEALKREAEEFHGH
jgi:hypothetical protein